MPEDSLFRYTVTNRAPEYHVTDTEAGTMYAAYRAAEPGQTYWRFANFMLPFWTQTPQGKFTEHLHNRAWVPMDDNHTMFVSLRWRGDPPSIGPDRLGRMMPGFQRAFDYLPNTTDWYGRWRLHGRPENDWLIDREAQRHGGNFTGIAGIHEQDQAVTESMGPVTDHLFEHLAPSDRMIMATRRRLLETARASGQGRHGAARGRRSGDHVPGPQRRFRDRCAARLARSLRPRDARRGPAAEEAAE